MGRGVRDSGEVSGYALALNQSGRAALERPRPGTRGLSPMQAERSARRAYGSGSIIERNGDWYGKWRVDGRQVFRKIGPKRTRGEADGLTKSQAESRLRELMAEVKAYHVRTSASAMRRPHHYTVGELCDLFIEHAREHRGLKERRSRTTRCTSVYTSRRSSAISPFSGSTRGASRRSRSISVS